MRDDRDYKLDLSSAAGAAAPNDGPASPPQNSRPYISVHFVCCNVYLRIYRTPDGTAYRGHCPKCTQTVNFTVGQGGTDSRVFRVT